MQRFRIRVVVTVSTLLWSLPLSSDWVSGGPDGGSTTAIVFNPSAPLTVFVGTRNAGLFRSVDGGGTWSPIEDPMLPVGIATLAAAADGSIYVGAGFGESGILRSLDQGVSWLSVHSTSPKTIATDPAVAATVYFGSADGYVFKSIDAGLNWTSSNIGLAGASVMDLAVDPLSSAVLYLGSGADGVFKSVDGGATWVATTSAPFETVRTLQADTSSPTTVYVGSLFEGGFKSINGGGSWTALGGGLPNRVDSLAVDPVLPSRLFAGNFSRIFRSVDSGATWAEVLVGVPGTDILDLLVKPPTGGVLAAAASGVVASADGVTFSNSDSGLRAARIDGLVGDPTSASTLFARSAESGIFKTNDDGLTWVRSDVGIAELEVRTLAIAESQPNVLYAASGSDVYRSLDGGATWLAPLIDPEDFGVFGPDILSLAVVGGTSDTVVAGSRGEAERTGTNGIYRTVDGGASWLPVYEFPAGFRDLRPLEIASTAALPTRLFAGYLALEVTPTFPIKTALLRSVDSGVTWQEVFATTGGTDIRINVDPLSPDTIYAVISKDAGPEIVKSVDGGATWAPLAVGVPGVTELLPDPAEAGTIWAAGDRVYVSENSGTSWTMFDDTGLPSAGGGIRTLERTGSLTPRLHAGTMTGVFSSALSVSADLAVTKDDGVGEVLPGGSLLYAVTVENFGPADVVGAQVEDSLPATLTCNWTCTGSGGGACSPGPVTGDINTAVDLPAGADVVFSVDCGLDGGATDLVSNTATVAVPVGVVDSAGANNSATDADVVLAIGSCGAYEDRALSNLIFDTAQTVEACNSISAGDSVSIVQPANVLFRAGSSVVLDDGFSVGESALFAVDLDQPMP